MKRSRSSAAVACILSAYDSAPSLAADPSFTPSLTLQLLLGVVPWRAKHRRSAGLTTGEAFFVPMRACKMRAAMANPASPAQTSS